MTDERRWTITVCNGCDELLLDDCGCDWDAIRRIPTTREVVVVPVSSVVPITRLRAWIENERAVRAALHPYSHTANMDLAELEALLLECASNPNNERTT